MDWEKLKQQNRPVVLYGMGNGADRVLAALDAHGIPAAAVFASDDFARGQLFHGFPVLTYAQARECFPDMTVLLCFGTGRPEVLERIDRIAEEYPLYAPDFPVCGETLFTRENETAFRERLQKVRTLLADEQSRTVFDSVISYKRTAEIRFLRKCETSPDEAFENILRLKDGETFMDLGAYRGDTIREFVRWCPDYEKIYAFEPDAYTYRHLMKNTESLADCTCLQKAAGAEAGTVHFRSRGGRNSAAAADGIPVLCDSVDNVLAGEKVSYMNIDVEGQEYAALKGAERTIRTWKPKMLVAAYHRTEDLFEIPEQVLALRPDYRLYMRHYPQLPAWDVNYYFV